MFVLEGKEIVITYPYADGVTAAGLSEKVCNNEVGIYLRDCGENLHCIFVIKGEARGGRAGIITYACSGYFEYTGDYVEYKNGLMYKISEKIKEDNEDSATNLRAIKV